MSGEERRKLLKLKEILKEMGSALVAFSGGADSAFLLKVARDVLGEGVVAAMARSPLFPDREYREAESIARELNVRLIPVFTSELSKPEFVRNDPERCYWCKRELFEKLSEIARREEMRWIADGTNFEDLLDFRPGRKAALEYGVRSPLSEAGLTKDEIRILSRELGLPTWNKPPFACLATRIPYGVPISEEILEKVNRAEEFLLSLGFRQVRVRHHGEIARIEVEIEDMNALILRRNEITEHLRKLGYTYITLDLEGYRSGSLNRSLQKGQGANGRAARSLDL